MWKSGITLVVLSLAAFAATQGWQGQRQPNERLRLKEERMVVEYSVTNNEATVIVEAECEEALERVDIKTPVGSSMLRMRSEQGEELAVQGFVVESEEGELDEVLRKFSPGKYDISARSVTGKRALGSALFSHELPEAPLVTYPVDGDTNVPSSGLVVTWLSDPAASGYRLVLEQGENDGLTAQLPGGSSSFQVPDGILRSATQTHVEVGTIGLNGNFTTVEIAFTTR